MTKSNRAVICRAELFTHFGEAPPKIFHAIQAGGKLRAIQKAEDLCGQFERLENFAECQRIVQGPKKRGARLLGRSKEVCCVLIAYECRSRLMALIQLFCYAIDLIQRDV